MRSCLTYTSIAGVVLLLACSEPRDINAELEDYSILLNEANSLACACPWMLGYPDAKQCIEVLGSVELEEWRCFTRVLEGHEEAASKFLPCSNAASEIYVECLNTNYSCNAEVHADCTADHEFAVASCPQLPRGVESKFEACVD